ncbi:MAG: hypothetical protein V2G48_02420 [bacterium JZ-2024 1]
MEFLKKLFRWVSENIGAERPEERKTPQDEPVLFLEPGTVEEVQIAMTQFLNNSVPVVLFLSSKADRQIAFYAVHYFTDQTNRRSGRMVELYPGKVYMFFPYGKVFHKIFQDIEGNLSIQEVEHFELEHPFTGAHSGTD